VEEMVRLDKEGWLMTKMKCKKNHGFDDNIG
jgi:hypothetical protein